MFVTENRPWVSIAGEEIGSLGLKEAPGPRVEIVLKLVNSGRSPAHEVCIHARLIADPKPKATVAEIERRFRGLPRDIGADYVTTLLPQQTHELDFAVQGTGEGIEDFSMDDGERALLFTIAGFITYKSRLGEPENHATSFVYRVALVVSHRVV